jgi:hypothetical protein
MSAKIIFFIYRRLECIGKIGTIAIRKKGKNFVRIKFIAARYKYRSGNFEIQINKGAFQIFARGSLYYFFFRRLSIPSSGGGVAFYQKKIVERGGFQLRKFEMHP